MTAITFYSDDKKILQRFLDLAIKLNVKTEMQPVEDETALAALIQQAEMRNIDYGVDGVPVHVAQSIVEGLSWIEKRKKGEVEAITFEQMMAELKADEQKEAATA